MKKNSWSCLGWSLNVLRPARACHQWGKMHFSFLFVLFTFQGFHSSHFSSHFLSPFQSLFDHSSAKRTKRSRKVDRKVAENGYREWPYCSNLSVEQNSRHWPTRKCIKGWLSCIHAIMRHILGFYMLHVALTHLSTYPVRPHDYWSFDWSLKHQSKNAFFK